MEHEKLQTAKDDWDEDIMKQVEFINKRLHRRNEAKAISIKKCLNTTKYLRNQLSDFYQPSEGQKKC